MARECPTHLIPLDRYGDCPRCEAAIARIDNTPYSDDGGVEYDPADENRYERWLDQIGGSA